MFLIVGLGNPGKEYALTRHNVGFLFIDFLTKKIEAEKWKKGYEGTYTTGLISEKKVVILKPETYMNLSGKSVIACANFFKIKKENIIMITDDIDMEFGKVRYRETGSSGGHNGINSILESLGNNDIKRIKIGIGRHPNIGGADWVLSKFRKEELIELEETWGKVYQKLLELIEAKI